MLSIGLVNPKNVSNVGAVMRAAGCFGVDAVWYSGERYPRAQKFATDTKKSVQTIALQHTDSILETAGHNIARVCVELVEGATALPDYQHPLHACYVFGPEDGSLSQSMIDHADDVVYIPSTGCLNLAASVNVVLYDRLAKLGYLHEGQSENELIVRNRDCRNNLKLLQRTT